MLQWHNNLFKRWLDVKRSAIALFKHRIIYTWIVLHLLFIFLVNTVSVYSSYKEFHQQPVTSRVAIAMEKLLNARPFMYYGRYTGAETGYGFFGINVRSNGVWMGECAGEGITADFRSYETTLRFFSMGNALTDDFIKPGAQDSVTKHLKGDIMNQYNQLVFRNIAATLFSKHHCLDTAMQLSYNMLDFPTLAAVRSGAPLRYSLIKAISVNYSLNVYDHPSAKRP
ncbi:MAG TPA: hypothetical protein VM802_10540 [Chitinophaga sp.]|uniref:hypothetical protein n=1 Tax=Chitinophaga sp. TaxID=1869181 RepID=UPI002BEAFE8D|nr:hypothetical protein [Chitinophaga sp.]HVI45301.1 hypothetical protein [Chitinophaga sp.]